MHTPHELEIRITGGFRGRSPSAGAKLVANRISSAAPPCTVRSPSDWGFFYLGIHFIPGLYLIPAMLTFAKFADVRFACIRALALFPINNEHQTEQHHATWPNAADNPTAEEFAIGDELE